MCADALEEYERLVSESPKLLYSLRYITRRYKIPCTNAAFREW